MADLKEFEKQDYKGKDSTLCTGCGHDSITNHIITAYFQSRVSPYNIAKVSGIGCSSKTPTYFISKAHGFNSVHGRMAPLATGVSCANKDLNIIGISGDGDTASIGLGGFAHLIRRNVPMVYIVENNGVYGLTKGQFSATLDKKSISKSQKINPYPPIDLCSMAINLGCDFVARSFSGDTKQLVSLISAAIRHNGTAFIDVISPCITFANHEGSFVSFKHIKENKENLQDFGFIQPQQEVTADYEEGSTQEIKLVDGSILLLKKVSSKEHNIASRIDSLSLLQESQNKSQILTGLFYFKDSSKNFNEISNVCEKPLKDLKEAELKPSPETLDKLNEQLR